MQNAKNEKHDNPKFTVYNVELRTDLAARLEQKNANTFLALYDGFLTLCSRKYCNGQFVRYIAVETVSGGVTGTARDDVHCEKVQLSKLELSNRSDMRNVLNAQFAHGKWKTTASFPKTRSNCV